jgi:putative intracellular protease/amidase
VVLGAEPTVEPERDDDANAGNVDDEEDAGVVLGMDDEVEADALMDFVDDVVEEAKWICGTVAGST